MCYNRTLDLLLPTLFKFESISYVSVIETQYKYGLLFHVVARQGNACEKEIAYKRNASRYDFTGFIHHGLVRKCTGKLFYL